MARRLPQILTRDEARALLATPNRYYPTGQRDLCMIKLMLNAGLRSSESLTLSGTTSIYTPGASRCAAARGIRIARCG
jgi:site-specific recombinase XerD